MATYVNQRRRRAASVDITPLMDLTFMLLIVFIITVPAMEYSTDVTPPSMETPQTVEDIKDKAVLALHADGRLQLDNRNVTKNELMPLLKALKPDANLLIISDGGRKYEEVIELNRMAHHAGVKKIYLVTQAEQHK